MSDDCTSAARALLDGLERLAPADALVEQLVRAVGETQRGMSQTEAREVLAMLAKGLELPNPACAGIAARVLGAVVEAGHDPAPARAAVVGHLAAMLEQCAALSDDALEGIGEPPEELEFDQLGAWLADHRDPAMQDAAERMPDAARAWTRLDQTWPGVVAVLTLDPTARAEARGLYPLAESILGAHEAGGWLVALLGVLDEAPFVAIEPLTEIGIIGRMSGIVDNFQLATLLMDAFPGEHRLAPRRVSKAAAAVARGEGPQQTRYPVTQVWDMHGYPALGPERQLTDPVDPQTIIALDGMPAEIPLLDGHHVILLGPAADAQTWRAQRMFAGLQATLAARPLDRGAVSAWLKRIAAADAE